jgi:alcohol dehydrogenase
MGWQFSIARLPCIEFGAGCLSKLPDIVASYGKRLVIVTGARSFPLSPHRQPLYAALKAKGLVWSTFEVSGEPSPTLVDEAVRRLRGARPDTVIGIGGGSVLDAAKAIAGLLRPGNSVLDHLEGVGPEKPYEGPATPFIAVPTTAGTGSEATKNAVLSVHGERGYKKSFRDEKLVAAYALVDPDLLATCPPPLIAANGMDALTQLLESYVSPRANALTNALVLSGLAAARYGLPAWYEGGERAARGREKMAYAALISGIALAQTGLGSVHGLASPLGAFFPIAHGVVCGTLVAAATQVNIDAMKGREPDNPALVRYAQAGRLLGNDTTADDDAARALLVEWLERRTERMALPRLSECGVTAADLPRIVANCRGSSMKTNPIVLSDEEVTRVLQTRL